MMTGGARASFIDDRAYHWLASYGWRAVCYPGLMSAQVLFFICFKELQVQPAQIPKASSARDDDRAKLHVGIVQLVISQQIHATTVGRLFCVATLLLIRTSQGWLPTARANISLRSIRRQIRHPLLGHDLPCYAKSAGGPHRSPDARRTFAQVGRNG
jgi:hypothetical protein